MLLLVSLLDNKFLSFDNIYLSHKGLHILAFASKHILVLLFLIGVLFCFSMLCPMMHNINFVEWLLMCCSSLGFTHHHQLLLLHHHLLLYPFAHIYILWCCVKAFDECC
uniref:Uncharacterized protein n=1 Tax=Populus davidiana TaxID=266767 RepID=A0A6M2F1W4_9ROSI